MVGGLILANQLRQKYASRNSEPLALDSLEERDNFDHSSIELVVDLHRNGDSEHIDPRPESLQGPPEAVEQPTLPQAPRLIVHQIDTGNPIVQPLPAPPLGQPLANGVPRLLNASAMRVQVVPPAAQPIAVVKPPSRSRRRTASKSLHVLAGIAARNELGLDNPKNYDANRVTARRYIRKYLVERGVRESDIMRFAPKALVIAMTPTKYEIEARELECTNTIQTRRNQLKISYFSFTSLFGALMRSD